ncbi:MAG: hypothetical protein ACR2OY_04540 [Boseongicola sp.]
MSERWGFDLSMEAVRLMRHTAGHWREIAREKIEGADIESRLQRLADRVDPPNPVFIFLPRDQILYTDVKTSSEANAPSEIDKAMNERTPYAIDELEVDWEQNGPGVARVAAIARETLDEAEAFATARGLTVAGFSALAEASEFPRLPDFGGVAIDLLSDVEETVPDAAPTFTSRRTSEPPPTADDLGAPHALNDDLEPVVKVDDPTPVMQLPESDLPPLDPGIPLPRVRSEPRVVTDVGAATASIRAASLTARPPVHIRRRDRAVPTPALAAVAALLSVGIAGIIWSILPTTPGTSDLSAPAPSIERSTQPEDSAATQPIEPAAPALSDVAPGIVVLDIALAAAPENVPAPMRPSGTAKGPAQTALAFLPSDIPATEAEPLPTLPLELDKRPAILVGVEDAVPMELAPHGVPLSETSRGITIAALDGIIPKTDALAMPVLRIDPAVTFDTEPPARQSSEEEVAVLPDARDAPPTEDPGSEIQSNAVEQVPEVEPDQDVPAVAETTLEPGGEEQENPAPALVPTELARALPDRAPLARPQDFITRIERQTYGGRSLAELKKIRPGSRPASAQIEALVALVSREPSDLAVEASVQPRTKPNDFDAIVAAIQVQREAEQQAAVLAASAPDTTAAIEAALADDTAAEEAAVPQETPRLSIPSSASVARQATLENAIRLNRVNLVGVYGLSSDRRALVRLPSGRYVKVKVGDRVDGGTVASISESELRYTKRGKTIALKMPKG